MLQAIKDMAVDATGDPVEPAPTAGNTNSNARSEEPKSSESAKVTRNVKGKKRSFFRSLPQGQRLSCTCKLLTS